MRVFIALMLAMVSMGCSSSKDDSASKAEGEGEDYSKPVSFDKMVFNRCVPEPNGGGAYLFNDSKYTGHPGIWFVKHGLARKIFDEAKITRCVPTPDGGSYLFDDTDFLGEPGVWYMKNGEVTKVVEASGLGSDKKPIRLNWDGPESTQGTSK
ncbi:MAG: hypothetical protein BroJett009_24210 [Armatimonadota bacterium]|nr:MAG: hypothetical protein BroJett009_24210 [Armatimonadota bacterium]